jgi:hypothetical protein
MYKEWRHTLLNRQENDDPVNMEMDNNFYYYSDDQKVQYLNKFLCDEDVHEKYTRKQIGIAINYLYSNACSDYVFMYRNSKDNLILNLNNLYKNYFNRHCIEKVSSIGNSHDGDSLYFMCYMFWDLFVIHPGIDTDRDINDGYQVMENNIYSNNENIIVSVIHGLGHWVHGGEKSVIILDKWLNNPSTDNEIILEYAEIAKTGCIQ